MTSHVRSALWTLLTSSIGTAQSTTNIPSLYQLTGQKLTFSSSFFWENWRHQNFLSRLKFLVKNRVEAETCQDQNVKSWVVCSRIKVQRADLTCDVIRNSLRLCFGKIWILVADWSMPEPALVTWHVSYKITTLTILRITRWEHFSFIIKTGYPSLWHVYNYQGRWNQGGKGVKRPSPTFWMIQNQNLFHQITFYVLLLRPPGPSIFSDLLPSLRLYTSLLSYLLTKLHICLSICNSTRFQPITYFSLMYLY